MWKKLMFSSSFIISIYFRDLQTQIFSFSYNDVELNIFGLYCFLYRKQESINSIFSIQWSQNAGNSISCILTYKEGTKTHERLNIQKCSNYARSNDNLSG